MQEEIINKLSERLYNARTKACPIVQLSNDIEDFTESDAYRIQELGIELRKNDSETVIGMKMGLTSEAKRKQMNLHSPLYGVLTNKMQLESGDTIDLKNYIHPKIEPEVAFLTSKDLRGPVSKEDVIEACPVAYAAMEILDSRYEHFKYFSLEDVIADNSSSCLFVLGGEIKNWQNLEIDNLNMKMKVNGKLEKEGNSKEISGNPLTSVMQLCELLEKRDQFIPAGSIVLTGAATTAIQLDKEMEISLEVEGLGHVSVRT